MVYSKTIQYASVAITLFHARARLAQVAVVLIGTAACIITHLYGSVTIYRLILLLPRG